MNLISLQFDESNPHTIAVSMSIEEAIAIAALFGKLNHFGLRRLGITPVDGEGIYNCLVGDVLNRYWDGGLDEAGPPKFNLAEINDPNPKATPRD